MHTTPPSHAKWRVENNAIKGLKDNWYMEHNFHHHPNATCALLLILFVAHNLFYAYVFRHLKVIQAVSTNHEADCRRLHVQLSSLEAAHASLEVAHVMGAF